MSDHASAAPRSTRPLSGVLARRGLLLGGAALSLGAIATRGLAAPAIVGAVGSRTKIKFTWNQTALCTSAVPIAVDRGIFDKHDLDVELINFGG